MTYSMVGYTWNFQVYISISWNANANHSQMRIEMRIILNNLWEWFSFSFANRNHSQLEMQMQMILIKSREWESFAFEARIAPAYNLLHKQESYLIKNRARHSYCFGKQKSCQFGIAGLSNFRAIAAKAANRHGSCNSKKCARFYGARIVPGRKNVWYPSYWLPAIWLPAVTFCYTLFSLSCGIRGIMLLVENRPSRGANFWSALF